MKVFAENIRQDIALNRVAAAIKKYAPDDVTAVNSKDEADLVILYAFGQRDHFTAQAELLKSQGKKYAVVQISLRRTMSPKTSDWMPLWQGAEVVWSYYDLAMWCREDKVSPDFNFYHAPLGVDEIFRKSDVPKEYVIASSGPAYTTESARECIKAAERVDKRAFHVGPVIIKKPWVDFADGMDDTELAKKYSACEFVSGLRHFEGFELPVIEGLVCGARPICFDAPHYRKWFDRWAVFIPETGRENIIQDLVKIFEKGAKPVTEAEITEARGYFNWHTIIEGFWDKIRHND
jgi:hypothetical protein